MALADVQHPIRRHRHSLWTSTAAVWSLLTGSLGLFWAVGGPGFPFGANDRRADEVGSLFMAVDATGGGAAIAVLGLVGLAVSVRIGRGHRSRLVTGTAWAISAVLLLVVPDIRVIQNFAYLFFGYTGLWDRPLLFMLWSMTGGALFAMTATDRHRRERIDNAGAPAAGNALARWLLRHRNGVTYLAAALALPYPNVRSLGQWESHSASRRPTCRTRASCCESASRCWAGWRSAVRC
jgi:hypothetical protein